MEPSLSRNWSGMEPSLGGTEGLLTAIQSKHPPTRWKAADALSTMGDEPQIVTRLMALTDHANSGVRAAAAYTLGKLGNPQAIEALAALLADTAPAIPGLPAGNVARLAVEALEAIDADEARRISQEWRTLYDG